MKKFWLCFGVAGVALLFASFAAAQEVVFNGDYETGDYVHGWTLTGGNAHTVVAKFQTVQYQNSLCLKRRPGTPNDNGGIQQELHLFEGITYVFSANIASQYCSS
ncbi:MAG: hypothetical protein ACYTG7_13295 [Planctomycetota bacterium]